MDRIEQEIREFVAYKFSQGELQRRSDMRHVPTSADVMGFIWQRQSRGFCREAIFHFRGQRGPATRCLGFNQWSGFVCARQAQQADSRCRSSGSLHASHNVNEAVLALALRLRFL